MSPRRAPVSLPCQHGTDVRALVSGGTPQYARRMSSGRLTLFVVTVTVAAFPLALAEASGSLSPRLLGEAAIAAVIALPSAVVALLVERRRPTGWLGPMLALAGCLPAVALLGDLFKRGSFGEYAVALSAGSWPLLFLAPALLLLFFPGGRVRGRDRWLAAAIVADAALFVVVAATYPAAYSAPYAHSPHVFGELPHAVAVALAVIVFPGLAAALVLTLVSVVRRFRRSEGLLRAQMLWLGLGGMLLPLALLAAWARLSRSASVTRSCSRDCRRLCGHSDRHRYRGAASRSLRCRPRARLDGDACRRHSRRARDLHSCERHRRPLPPGERSLCRRGRSDSPVRCPAGASAGRACSVASIAGSIRLAGRRRRRSSCWRGRRRPPRPGPSSSRRFCSARLAIRPCDSGLSWATSARSSTSRVAIRPRCHGSGAGVARPGADRRRRRLGRRGICSATSRPQRRRWSR